jgi:curved DNA-binding protein CbpA
VTSSAETDPYAVLGVARTATEHEIRTAYRALVARYHPDRHQDNPLQELASAKLAEINRAYAILSDPARRGAFDAGRGYAAEASDPGAPGAGPRANARLRKLIALVFALPLLLRFGMPVVRVLSILVRDLFEATALLRGTPVAAVLVLSTVLGLTIAFVRRRRSQARARTKPREPNEQRAAK